MFKLQSFIKPNNLFFNLKATGKKGILREMVNMICEVENRLDHEESLLQLILNREKIESTGIGKGFAIPHCQYDDFDGLHLYVAFPKNPIAFKSQDDSLVRIIFMIISNNKSNELYLKALSRLMYLIRNAETREKFFTLNNKDDFLKVIENSDSEMDYISYNGLRQIISLLEIDSEIKTYSHETLIEKGKRQGTADLKEDSQYLRLQNSHAELVNEVDSRLLYIYNQLKQKFDGDIISRVHKNVCSYCNFQLPVHIMRELNRKNQIIQCSTCCKILVRPERPMK